MKILHILKREPDASTKKIIEMHASAYDVKIIEFYKGSVSYDKLVMDLLAYDKVFWW